MLCEISIPITVNGLLSFWTGLVLFVFFCFSIYRINECRVDIEDATLSQYLICTIVFFLISKTFSTIPVIERFFLSIFYFLFPIWCIVHMCRSIWFF